MISAVFNLLIRLYDAIAQHLCWHHWVHSELDGYSFCVHCGAEKYDKTKLKRYLTGSKETPNGAATND